MEAAHTLSNDILKQGDFPDDEDSRSSEETDLTEQKPKIDEKDEFRSSSIAALRAKAQEHSAKMFGSYDRGEGDKVYPGQDLPHQPHFPGQAQTSQQSVFWELSYLIKWDKIYDILDSFKF